MNERGPDASPHGVGNEPSPDFVAVLTGVAAFLDESIAVIELARVGLRTESTRVHEVPTYPENPDPLVLVGEGDPNDPSVQPTGAIRRSRLLEGSQKGGAFDRLLGQLWLVATCTVWEKRFRPDIARAMGRSANELTSEVFGDLTKLRNDVVHHGGIVSNATRCRVLGPFTRGSVVEVDANLLKQVRAVWVVEAGAYVCYRANPVQLIVNPASVEDRVADT